MSELAESRILALSCLAFLDVEPEQHLAAAAAAGFDRVTLRVTGMAQPVAAETGHDPRRLDLLRRVLDASGLGVLDVEVLRLSPALASSDVQRVLEAAATLGARHLLVVNSELGQHEATDRLGEVVALAAGTGVTPCLEPMRFSRCRNLAEAVATAVPAGAAVLVDALHLHRSGDGPAAVRDAVRHHGSGLFPYLQICDAVAGERAEGPGADDALRDEAVRARLLPGDGDLPLVALLSELTAGLPLAVEAPTRALSGAAPGVRAGEAMRAVRGVLTKAARSPVDTRHDTPE